MYISKIIKYIKIISLFKDWETPFNRIQIPTWRGCYINWAHVWRKRPVVVPKIIPNLTLFVCGRSGWQL